MGEKVRIVIPVHNQFSYTKQCIEGIFNSTIINNSKYELEVFVVDNGSTDETKQELENDNRIKYIRFEQNKGFAGAVNYGLLHQAIYEYAIVLNNDVLIPSHLFERMMYYMEDRKIGMLGPKSNFAGGTQGLPYGCCTSDGVEQYSDSLYSTLKRKGTDVGLLVGLCLLIRKKVIDEVGVFDDIYFPGTWEDVDYSIRARLLGWKLVVAEDCFIYHFGSKSSSNSSELYFHVNKNKFYNKWSKINKIGEKKRIIGAMRVKNGEPWIEKTLEKISLFCDEIAVLVSNQSTDNTYEICKKFPKVTKLLLHEEDGYNETKDRNRLLEMVKELKPDWVYCGDVDEIPEDRLIERIQELCNTPDPLVEGYVFKICHFWNGDQIRCDGLWNDFFQCRFYKFNAFQKIESAQIHCGSHPPIPAGLLCHSFLRIKHYGNIDREGRERKYKYYMENDKEKNVSMILGRWEQYYKDLYKKDKLENEDYYKHIVDETGLVLEDWVEDNGISLCMVVKNEEKWIYKCLSNVNKLVDEIIVIDTGCTDKTMDIVKNFPKAKTYRYLDASELLDGEWELLDYSKARNFSLRKATKRWILRIDADEILEEQDLPSIFIMTQNQKVDAYLFPIKNIQPPDGKHWVLSETCRLFKNTEDIYYSGLIHEEIEDSLTVLSKTRIASVVRSPICLIHLGYMRPEEERTKKYEKYARLAQQQLEKDPDNAKILYTLGVHYYCRSEIPKAIRYFYRAAKLNFWMAYNDLGVIFLRKGNALRAKECFLKALDLGKKSQGHDIYLNKVKDNLKRVDILEEYLRNVASIPSTL